MTMLALIVGSLLSMAAIGIFILGEQLPNQYLIAGVCFAVGSLLEVICVLQIAKDKRQTTDKQ